ncbi:unnamed protein product, partial [Rotaria sp. Silwood1]
MDLKLTSDNDPQLRQLADRIRKEVDGTGWYRMGQLLLKISQLDKAEELYTALLEETSNDTDKARINNKLGDVKYDQGRYEEAMSFYKTAFQIYRKALPKDHSTLAEIYNSIGAVHNNMANHSRAVKYFETALKIRKQALPSTHSDIAQSYAWVGAAYNNMGEYSKALEFYEKAHKIYEIALPSN